MSTATYWHPKSQVPCICDSSIPHIDDWDQAPQQPESKYVTEPEHEIHKTTPDAWNRKIKINKYLCMQVQASEKKEQQSNKLM